MGTQLLDGQDVAAMFVEKASNQEGLLSTFAGQGHLLQEAAELAVDAQHLELLLGKACSSLRLLASPAAATGQQMTPVQRHLVVTAYGAAAGMLRSWQRGKALVEVGMITKKELKAAVVKLGDPFLAQWGGAASSRQDMQNKLRDMRAALDALTGGWVGWQNRLRA
jgi:hypothetical protein